MQTSVWKGSRAVREAPDSPDFDFADGVNSCERIFVGPRDVLLATRPAIGEAMEGIPADYLVERVRIKPGRGGKTGRMMVSLKSDFGGSSTPGLQAGQWVNEVEWAEAELPLIQNARYAAEDGEKYLTDDDLDAIREWERQGRPSLALFEYEESSSWDNAKDYMGKIMRGREVFRAAFPICRRTRTVRGTVTSGAGYIQDCPIAEKPDGYLWFKSADRCTKTGRNGKWIQFQEWTGFEDIDTDLYYVHADAMAAKRRFLRHFTAMRRALDTGAVSRAAT
jgi:hypothetical protein